MKGYMGTYSLKVFLLANVGSHTALARYVIMSGTKTSQISVLTPSI